MTAEEMEYEFKITYESMASMNAPGYTSREISVLLTQAQEEIAIETAQKRLDSDDYARTVLEKLLTPYSSPTVASSSILFNENAYRVTIPNNFLYPFVEFAITGGTTTNRAVKPITYDSYYTSISNPFANPYKDLYWRVFENGYLTIITDGTALTGMKGLYVAKPNPIITSTAEPAFYIDQELNTEGPFEPTLHFIVHREIVYRAAKKAFAAVKDQIGYQIQNVEENQ